MVMVLVKETSMVLMNILVGVVFLALCGLCVCVSLRVLAVPNCHW